MNILGPSMNIEARMTHNPSPYFEDKWFSFFSQKQRWLTSAAMGVAGVAVLIFYFQSSPKPEAFIAAEEAVERWQSSRDEESYLAMTRAFKTVPALEKKYEAIIAQRLVEKDQLEQALILAHRSLSRVHQEAPFHAAYGETSLMIEQGNYQEALQRSVSLKEQMAKMGDWNRLGAGQYAGGALLYAHNLLRIAFLQQELVNPAGERVAWEDLEVFLGANQSLAALLFKNFREKEIDLTNYIAERKQQLIKNLSQ